MADLPRINWDGTTWQDVDAYLVAHPNRSFLDRLLTPDPPPDWVTSGDTLGARISRAWSRFNDAIDTADTGTNDIIGGAADAAAGAAAGVRQAGQLAPYLAVGAGVVLVYLVARAR